MRTIFSKGFYTSTLFTGPVMCINETGPFLTQSVGSFATHFGNWLISPTTNAIFCFKFHDVEGNRLGQMFHSYTVAPTIVCTFHKCLNIGNIIGD